MPLRILLVDPRLKERQALIELFRGQAAFAHFSLLFFQAADEKQALDALEKEKPTLVMVASRLSKGDGMTFCQAIPRLASGKDIALMLIADPEDDKPGKQIEGESDWVVLSRPFQPSQFVQKVLSILSRYKNAHPDVAKTWVKGTASYAALRDAGRPAAAAAEGAASGAMRRERGSAASFLREEQGPKPMLDSAMLSLDQPARGSLEQRPLVWFLVHADVQGATGTLKLARGRVRKVVFFREGKPIYVESNLRHETLGAYLVSCGLLSEEQLAQALQQARATSQKLGQVLIGLGLADEETVMQGLQGQVRLKLASALRWPDGAFVWLPGEDLGQGVPCCPVEPVELVLSVLKRMFRVEDIALAAYQEHSLRLTSLGERYRSTIELVFGADSLGQAISGSSLRQAMVGDLDLPALLVEIQALLYTGLAEFVATPSSLAVLPSELPPIAEVPHFTKIEPLQKVAPSMETMGSVEEEADEIPIFEEEPQEAAVPSSVRSTREASAVLAAIPEKPLLLPLELVETTPAEKPPTAMRAPAPSVELSPPEDVLEDVVSIEVFEEAAPAEAAGGGAALPHLLELKDLDPTSSRPSGLEMEIALLEAEDLGPPLHAEPEESGVLIVPETLGIATPFVASLPAGEQEYDAFGAELYFQEGQTLLRQNAFSGAVAAFGRAVEAYPDQPDYHAFLGWAMFLHKGRGEAGALAARPHLKQAFRIAPDSAQAHELAGWVERDARNHLKAVEYLTRALALGAPRLDLFQTVKEIFEHLELYDELEQQYRQLIFRLREKEPLKTVPLWVDLAYLYLRRFGRADQAKVALQVAVKLAPSDPRVKAALQALGESTSQEWPQVAEGHRQRWRTSPNDLTPLHGLVAMHLAGNRPDHALTAASILGYLGAANESEQRFLRQLKPKGLLQTARPLESAQLKILRLPEDDENVESLMAHLSPLLSTHYPMVPEALGSGEDKHLEEDSLPARFTSAARYAARRLGTSLPPLYVSTTLGLEAMPFAEERERIAVGQELLDSTDEARIAFALARALSCLPRGRRHLFSRPVAELKEPVLATLALFRTSIGSSDTTSDRIAGWQEALRGLLATTSPLEELIGLLLKDPKINLSAWRRAVRRTSARAALLVGADLGAALQAVAGEADIQQDLMDFVLGETYAELRRALSCSAAV